MLGATLQEIRMQTQAWAEAIQVVQECQSQLHSIPWKEFDQVIFSGCGSTYYLSLSAAALFQSLTGKISRAFPASELLLSPACLFPKGNGKSLLFAISRSGMTSETLEAVGRFSDNRRGTVITVTNHEDSPLARMGKLNFSITSGKEESIVQTKSFASMFVACTAISLQAAKLVKMTGDLANLIPTGERVLETYEELAREIGQNHEITRFFFLGNGPWYGLACEASLKMKEMSLTTSEPFHFLEFRHGPISMVDGHTMVVGLHSEEGKEYEKAVMMDVMKLGGQTLTLGEEKTDVAFGSGIPEPIRGVLYLPFLQLLAYYRAVSYDLNPDQPRNLTAVVQLAISKCAN